MSITEKAIEVHVPVHIAYNQWTQFEAFPQFMEGVLEVKQLDDQRLHWRAKVGGKEKEWDAVITEQIPDTRIAWRETEGTKNSGVVTFHRLSDDTTRIMVQMGYDPEGFIETAGALLGVMALRLNKDLTRFKEFIEERGEETGAWRGEIPQQKT